MRSLKNVDWRIGLLLLAGAGCSQSESVLDVAEPTPSPSSVSTTTTSTSSGSSSSTSGSSEFSNSCTTQVVDRGNKGVTAGTQRGLHSDTAIIPGTEYPATVFTDQGGTAGGNLVVKFSYWNGTEFVTENIAGQAQAKLVKVAFLSSGIPVVVWSESVTVGTNFYSYLRVAVRAQALSSSSLGTSTWNVGLVDSQGPAATATPDYVGIRMAVSPADQVLIGYIYRTGTGTNNNSGRFAYCNTSCSNTANYVAMSVAGNGIGNVAPATTVQTVSVGVGWCNAGSSTYYPMVGYGTAAASAIVYVCQNTLANCTTATNWTNSAAVAAGTGAFQSFDLLVDSSVVGDVPKVALSYATLGVRVSQNSAACNAAPATYTAGSWSNATITATASTGASAWGWVKLLKDTVNGYYHLIATDGANTLKYWNSQNTSFNGTWNNAGTIESLTTTLFPTTGFGGAALSNGSTHRVIYASYPTGNTNPANSTPYDLRMGVVNSFTTASNSTTFGQLSIDQSGSIIPGVAAQVTGSIALATTSAGIPAVAYTDQSANPAVITSGILKYSLRSGANAQATWYQEIVPNTRQPAFPSLAFHPSTGKPYIGYWDVLALRFYMVTNSSADGTGTWETYEFPDRTITNSHTLPATMESCIVMHNNGTSTDPVMIALENGTGSVRITSARLMTSTGRWSSLSTTPITLPAANSAAHLSCVVDSSNNIGIAIQNFNTSRVNYAASSDGGTTWSSLLAIAGSTTAGIGARLALNPSTGYPSLAWYDTINNQVLYSTCSGSVSACSSSGWAGTPTTVTSGAGLSSIFTAVNNASGQLLSTGLVFSNAGTANLIYTTGPTASGNLVRATASGSSFDTATFVSGANGALNGLGGVGGTGGVINYGIPWMSTAVRASSTGNLITAYLGPGNALTVTSCGD